MNIQIFGTQKCAETRKALRFFKERNILFHFRDLNEKGVSVGELENIKKAVPLEQLFDSEGIRYRKRNLMYMKFDIEEELLKDPLLFSTPIVRNKGKATVGYQPDVWQAWLKEK